MNILITGVSRGIGLELARQALTEGHSVIGVARAVTVELERLKGIHVVIADLLDPAAPAKITKALQDWTFVDILVNNAGIMRAGVTTEDFMLSFQVNSVAPFIMTKALTPWLRKSGAPCVINITSLMGSIADNGSGGYYAYRSSKTALNMINKSLAVDSPWLTTVVVHPGWVKTDMGGEGAPVEPKRSAAGIWQIARDLKPSQSGKFFNYTGEELPW